MKEFHVIWEIDIWAKTPMEAAQAALQLQRDQNSAATVFDVIDEDGESIQIDLLSDEE